MSSEARVTATDPLAEGGAMEGPARAADPAGRFLGRLTVLPALLAMAWLLAGLPLLLFGLFTPALMLVVSVPLALLLGWFGLRWIPGRCQVPLARATGGARTPWWAVAGVVAVAVAFGIDQMIFNSQQIIVTRDPASYFQFGYWIAGHGSLPILPDHAAFGGPHPGLSFSSLAFYQHAGSVIPQFMAGLPMVLAGGIWIGGAAGGLAMAPVLGALAVLTFGGLVGRLAGVRWAPLGALALAACMPEQFTSRATYSEPLAQILFLGGLSLVADSFGAGGRGRRVLAAAGGLALGLTVLVRIDGASDILPVIPYWGLLVLGRRKQAGPLLGGLAVGVLFGAVDGLLLSRPYLMNLRSVLIPLAVIVAVVTIGTIVVVGLLRDRGLPGIRRDWLPNAAAVLAVVVTAGFAIRPYVQTVHGANGHTEHAIAAYQRAGHLPVDPTRLYYEDSLHWVFWYIGLPAVVLGTVAAAILARRCLKGQAPVWVLPLMAFAWTIVTVLYRPSITPDQPWASRRLVPAVLPGFILLAVWASSWLIGWLRQSTPDRKASGALAVVCAAFLVLPGTVTAFGLGVKTAGPLGFEPTTDRLAFTSVFSGELVAINRLCAAIPPDSSVVIIDGRLSAFTTELVRGMCDVPTGHITSPTRDNVAPVVQGIKRAGRRPVLLAATSSQLAPYGGPAKQVMDLRTTNQPHTLVRPARTASPFRVSIWMSEP